MIAKLYRFHGYNSLKHVYNKGKTVRGPLFSIKYLKSDRRKTYRLAVVVSKKVHKSAVVRNRIRRRIFEAVRLQQAKIIDPYEIVLTVFSVSVATMPSDELRKAIYAQLKQAKII